MAILDQNEEEKEVEFDKMAIIVPTTLATIESLTFPLQVQEVVLLADFRCKRCQDRVADIVSRLDGEAESMEISLKEKKVTITLSRRHPKVLKMLENELQSVTMYKSPANKCSIVRKMFHSSCG
uniref:heavy metal-associated isoprenylated plant protein 45-like isoform X1 n=1 Tax=Erigeron canadensis TaxID=72917 RepID=UPI001CB9ABB6|nr:heavy metal-associated isoprenylated plant protein 45-like isoform X1 [Erigeron canadensis]